MNDDLAAEIHVTNINVNTLLSEVRELKREVKAMTQFVEAMKATVVQMADNPMLKAIGMGGFDLSNFEHPTIPGMPSR